MKPSRRAKLKAVANVLAALGLHGWAKRIPVKVEAIIPRRGKRKSREPQS